MDNLWERSIPFYNMGIKEIAGIFTEYDKHFEILNYIPINIGCRNSNYKVHTNKGYFLLRVCPLNDISYICLLKNKLLLSVLEKGLKKELRHL